MILIQELTKQEEDGSVDMPKKKTTRKKKSTVNKAGNYTKPTMRKKLFSRINFSYISKLGIYKRNIRYIKKKIYLR